MKKESSRSIAQKLLVSAAEEFQVSGYQIDSRFVLPGELFFALKGEKVDGHQFLGEVKRAGGGGAVVKRGYDGPDFGLTLLFVEDVEASLQKLARISLEESSAKVIGITGSVGKTTTKDFIAELLSIKYKVAKTPVNYNTKLTLPLSILNREGGEEVLVLEMGMSEPGDLQRLLKIAEPEIAVLTKIALAHSVSFPGGLEEIAKNKGAIFSSPKLKIGVYAQEIASFPGTVDSLPREKRVSFSLSDQNADYFLSSADGDSWIDEKGIRAYQFIQPFSQKHVLHNLLAAIATARQMKLEWDEINVQLPKLCLPKMRFEVFDRGGITYINDAYNANPESMRAALESIPSPREGGKKIGVLGVMSPLGSFSETAHREVGQFAQKTIDHLLVFGSEAKPLFESFSEVKKPAELFTDLKELAERLKTLMSPGDVVLIKGSRVMQMEKLFELLP